MKVSIAICDVNPGELAYIEFPNGDVVMLAYEHSERVFEMAPGDVRMLAPEMVPSDAAPASEAPVDPAPEPEAPADPAPEPEAPAA